MKKPFKEIVGIIIDFVGIYTILVGSVGFGCILLFIGSFLITYHQKN